MCCHAPPFVFVKEGQSALPGSLPPSHLWARPVAHPHWRDARPSLAKTVIGGPSCHHVLVCVCTEAGAGNMAKFAFDKEYQRLKHCINYKITQCLNPEQIINHAGVYLFSFCKSLV